MNYRYFKEHGVEMIEIEVDSTNKVVRQVTDKDAVDYPKPRAHHHDDDDEKAKAKK